MFFLPFITAYHDIPIPNFYSEWIAAWVGLLAFAPLITNTFWQSPALPRSSFIFLLLLLITCLQDIMGSQPASPHFLLIQSYIAWAFLMTTLGYQLRQMLGWERLFRILAWSLLIASLINAGFVVLQLLQQFGFSVPIPKLQNYGMLAQSNHFADFTSLAIVSVMYLHAKHVIRPSTLALGLFIGLLMLSLSGSRSSMLYLSMIALLCGLLQFTFRQQNLSTVMSTRLFKVSLILLPSFVLLQLLLTTLLPESMIHTPVTRAMEATSNPSASLRWQFWQTSLALFSQFPLFGIGAGQMRWQTFLLADNPVANPAHIFFEHAHNLFLNLLAEMGIFAFLAVFGGLLLWVKAFFKNHALSLEAWWLLGILGVISIHSLLEYPLWYSYFLGIFAFLLGVGESSKITLTRLSQSAKRLLRLVILGMMIYGLVHLTLMRIAYQKLESHIAVASQTEMSNSQKQHLVDDMLWINANTLLAPYADLVLATYLIPNTTHAEIQLSLAQNAVHFIPLRKPCLNLIILLELRQEHALALQHLHRLLQISNNDLRQDIQQLPSVHAELIKSLVTEIQQDQHNKIR